MDNSVFTKIKRRLLSTTSKSTSYFVGKVDKSKSVIDLVNYFDMYCDKKFHITSKNDAIKIKPLKLTNDYFEELEYKNIKELEYNRIKLYKHITINEFKFLKELSDRISTEKGEDKKQLEDKYSDRLATIKAKCIDNAAKEYKKFNQLLAANKMQLRDMGQDNLYLGYPFIEGKFSSKKTFRAPLVLHKAKISYSNSQVTISLTGDSYVNLVFLISNAIENNVSDFDVHDAELRSDYLEHALEILGKNGITAESSKTKTFKILEQLSKQEFTDKIAADQNNTFKISNNALLGLFNIADNNIYFDLEKMERLSNLDNFNKKLYGDKLAIKKEEVIVDENNLKYIANLDNSQKRVLTRSLKDNLVIEGPPGTGKSQVLTNIIANEVYHGKKVLVVSEKVGAINVIKDRLRSLKEYSLIVPNKDDKKLFFDQLKDFEKIMKQENTKEFSSKAIDRKLLEEFDKFEGNVSSLSVGKFSFNDIVNFSQDDRYLEQEISDLFYRSDLNLNDLGNAYDQYSVEKETAAEEIEKIEQENQKPIYKKLKTSELTLFRRNFDELKAITKPKLLRKEITDRVFLKNDKGLFKGKLDDRQKELIEELASSMDDLNVKLYRNVHYSKLKLYKRLKDLDVDTYDEFKKFILHNEFQYTFNHIKNTADNFIHFTDIGEKISKLYEYKSQHNDIEIGKYLHRRTRKKIESNKYIESAFKEIIRLNTLKTHNSIKYVIDKTPDILELFSVVLLTPNMVSTLLPLFEDMFDVVVFDESSQLFVEKAIPSIYRSKKVIIAGDSKQLQPSNYFSSRIDDSDDELSSTDDDFLLKSESLLDFGKGIYNQDMLNYHYRSNYKELIEFSSQKFYEDGLKFANVKDRVVSKPVEVVNVKGKWVNNVNKEEANKVIDVVKHILKTRKNNETVGIISFNKKQSSYINNLLSESGDPMILEELDRVNEESREPEFLFAKNIENVQGDERDIIIMSVGYDVNVRSFGPLSQSGGENRLNVAITRAKQKIVLIKSFMGKDLSVNSDNEGPKVFKEYLTYCDSIDGASEDSIDNFSLDMEYTEITDVIEKVFSEYYIDYQENIGSFVFDAVIKDSHDNPLVCLMILDSSKADFQDLIARYIYLKSRGWKIYVIFDVAWIVNRKDVLKNINKIIKKSEIDSANIRLDSNYLGASAARKTTKAKPKAKKNDEDILFKLKEDDIPDPVSFEEHYNGNTDTYKKQYKFDKKFNTMTMVNCMDEDLTKRVVTLILLVTLNKYKLIDKPYIYDLDEQYVNEIGNLESLSIKQFYKYAVKSYNDKTLEKSLESNKKLESNVGSVVTHIKRNIHDTLKELIKVSKKFECGKKFTSKKDNVYAHTDLIGNGTLVYIDLSEKPKIDNYIISKAMFVKKNSILKVKNLCYVNPLYAICETVDLEKI